MMELPALYEMLMRLMLRIHELSARVTEASGNTASEFQPNASSVQHRKAIIEGSGV